MTAELSAALSRGAAVVTANARLARALRQAFGLRQLAAGRSAWQTPSLSPWPVLVDSLRAQHATAAMPPLLTPLQEQTLWESIVDASPDSAGLLQPHAAARLAAQAWKLIHQWRIPFGGRRRMPEWESTAEAKAFFGWAQQFEFHVEWLNRADSARTIETLLAKQAALTGPAELWLAGFDELEPRQRELVAALERTGTLVTHYAPRIESPRPPRLAPFADARVEADSAARWAASRLAENPDASIGIVVPDLEQRRPSIERAFRLAAPGAFHISIGPPLSDRPIIAAALRMLTFGEEQVPWAVVSSVLASPYVAGFAGERSMRAALDVELRRWRATTLSAWAIARHGATPPVLSRALFRAEALRRDWPAEQKPSDWSAAFSAMLEAFGWPGDATLGSVEFQIVDAWRSALSDLASTDLALPSISRARALGVMRRLASTRRFETESRSEPIQILGTLEAAGSQFDSLWIAGMTDEVWPARSTPNPFIPLSLQRKHNVPHSSPARELSFAARVARRLLQSATETVVSYARADTEREFGPSPLFASLPGLEESTAAAPVISGSGAARMEFADDSAAPPIAAGALQAGGTRALELQAKCPFRAFAELRVSARELEDPEPGLDPRDRGGFIHTALELFWKRYPSSAALRTLSAVELGEAVAAAVEEAVSSRRTGPDELAAKLLALERRRLVSLLTEWLNQEKDRLVSFEVVEPEQERTVEIGGLTVQVRLDRLDRLPDGRHILIDYKSKSPRLAGWDGTRPESPQLPIYAATAHEPLAAVAFAQVRTGECRFSGYAATEGALPGAKIVEPAELAERIATWRGVLTQLGTEFRTGRADVDPKDRFDSCDFCHLPALCRVEERKRGAE